MRLRGWHIRMLPELWGRDAVEAVAPREREALQELACLGLAERAGASGYRLTTAGSRALFNMLRGMS